MDLELPQDKLTGVSVFLFRVHKVTEITVAAQCNLYNRICDLVIALILK